MNFDLSDFTVCFFFLYYSVFIFESPETCLAKITYEEETRAKKAKNFIALIWNLGKTLLNAVMSAEQMISLLTSSVNSSPASNLLFPKSMI